MTQIMCVTPSAGAGWAPVTTMAQLMSRCLEAPLRLVHPARDYSRARRLLSLVPRRRGSKGHLILVAARPGDLLAMVGGAGHLKGFDSVSAWIFDSFWDDEIPRMARRATFVDHLFVPDAELVDVYARATRTPVTWLPWGTDSLAGGAGSFTTQRSVDVLRLGRQPRAWDDDEATRRLLGSHGLSFDHCPPFSGRAEENQRIVRAALERSKVVLASGNASSAADYTHPTREYITARWTDAAAAGTVVAGTPPRCHALSLLPPDGLLHIPVDAAESGIPLLRRAVEAWTPKVAGDLHRHARAHLDWRRRFGTMAETLGIESATLRAELRRLDV